MQTHDKHGLFGKFPFDDFHDYIIDESKGMKAYNDAKYPHIKCIELLTSHNASSI